VTTARIRVLLVEDHAALLDPLAKLMAQESDLEVIGAVGTLATARALLESGVIPDVMVLDLDLPDGDGTSIIPDLRRANSDAATLVLTASRNSREHGRAIAAGAAHVLHKSALIPEILAAIRQLHAGEALVDPQQLVTLLRLAAAQSEEERSARAALANLTPREREVLQLLAEGRGNDAIAELLGMRPETVRVHVRNILAKLDVQTRLQAVVLAYRHGEVQPSS
jgi:RNA polymerase sigma factor (sigma-70 family)